MIISHEHRYIFIKTQKTAGTSIELALSRYCGPRDVITPVTPEDEALRDSLGGRGPQNYHRPVRTTRDAARFVLKRRRPDPFGNHSTATIVRGAVSKRIWRTYFKFCVERNPWDKTLSMWHFRNARRGPLSFDAYVMSNHLKGLSDWDRYASDDQVHMDRVLRYEQLAEELDEVRLELGLPEQLVLPRAKGHFRTDRRPYWELIAPEHEERIAMVFVREITHFKYQFRPDQAARRAAEVSAR